MRKNRPFEQHITNLSFTLSAVLMLLLICVMSYAGISKWLVLLTALIGVILVVHISFQIHQKLVFQFRSLSNLMGAMMQGDYSLRARSDQKYGELGELVASINSLAERLTRQRRESVESQMLVKTVIEHIDVAIVALSQSNEIVFLNPAAKKLLMLDDEDVNPKVLDQFAFEQSFAGGDHGVIELSLGSQLGRFNVHIEEYREANVQNKLLFITDVRTLLRSEERRAWQSIVRVISHEINNSLTPIASISQTFHRKITQTKQLSEDETELLKGLEIISERANGLRQFVDSYKQLAKFPEPKRELLSLNNLINKVTALFGSQPFIIVSECDIKLNVDPVQFEQVLINLFKNAIEAMVQSKSGSEIHIDWKVAVPLVTIEICDQGSGITNSENLFVPYYSTKKSGSGIGLVLSRQIVEAHNGRLTLRNRHDIQGCCARIELPMSGQETPG